MNAKKKLIIPCVIKKKKSAQKIQKVSSKFITVDRYTFQSNHQDLHSPVSSEDCEEFI